MNITKRIKLDFGRASSPVVVWAKQGDEDSRFVEVVPLKNGNDYTIPSGVSIHFACKKPDGHQILNDYPTIKNNIITIPLTPQTLAVAGEGLASVILMDSATETILSTQNFILYIENNPLVGAEVESSDEYQSYLGALSKIEAFPYITPEAEGKVLGVKNGGYVFVDGGSGSGGSDGFSPSAKVEQTANGATITITDKDGTTVADIANGKDGESITIESVLGTDADGGENTIRFSDGTELIVRNGRKGTDGRNGLNGYSPEVTLVERDEGVYIEVQTQSGGSGATVYNGEDGKSAYAYAQDGGYTGTEEEFAEKLASDNSGMHIGTDEPDDGSDVWIDLDEELVAEPDEEETSNGEILWEGYVNISTNSSVSSLGGSFDAESYDHYDVTVVYGGNALGQTNVRCYPCKMIGGVIANVAGGAAISGHLCWYAGYWMQLDVMIYGDGTARLGYVYRDAGSSYFYTSSNTYSITKIVGYTR